MSIENPDLEPILKDLTFKPENEIRDHSGNLIEKVRLTVVHGTGRVRGVSWISVDLLPESAAPVQAGGRKIENNKFVMIGGNQVEEDEVTLGGQLAKALNTYSANHPAELERLKKELQKTE